MFTPILTASDLPVVDRDHETLQLDFKATADGSTAWEKAKDAAAFANAQGGVILVSAAEDKKRGVIGRYLLMDDRTAAAVSRAFDETIRDRCRPQPVFDVVNFEVRGEGRAVAVNVWPFIGQPVGVKPDLPPYYSSVSAFAFPVRVGTGTVYLSADQLPMFMQPEIRRIAILLSAIPAHDRARLLLVSRSGRPDSDQEIHENVRLVLDADELRDLLLCNTVKFEKLGSNVMITVPSDCIRRIWKNSDGRWIIRVAASFNHYEEEYSRRAPRIDRS